jgi:hypothetical protein
MLFITDEVNKVVFGWSAKCGCTHIKKIFWYLKTTDENHKIHIPPEYSKLPDDVENYTVVLFIRNPYERLVSVFLDTRIWSDNWKEPTITFNAFLNELLTSRWEQIDRHHFTRQTSEFFHYQLLEKSKELMIYDINKIDYKCIEKVYNKKLPQSLIYFKGDHARIETELMEEPVYGMNIELYSNYKVPTRFFYNDDLKKK